MLDITRYSGFADLLQSVDEKHRLELMEYLQNAPLWLISEITVNKLPAGKIFIYEGHPVTNIYLLVEGEIRAIDYHILGVEYEYTRIKAFNTFGSMEVYLNKEKYETSMATVTDSVILSIPRRSFEKWISTEPTAIRKDVKLLLDYMLDQAKKERIFLFLQGTARIVFVMHDLYAQQNINGICKLRITIEEIASMSGVSTKTVNRAMANMKDLGFISREGHQIIIDKEQANKMDIYLSKKIN